MLILLVAAVLWAIIMTVVAWCCVIVGAEADERDAAAWENDKWRN